MTSRQPPRTAPAPALALALALLAAPALAQDRTAAVEAVLDAAMSEAGVFLTCSALDAETHGFLRDYWQQAVAETLALLRERAVTPANLDRFAAAGEPGALLPADDTPFAEVAAFCAGHPDWLPKVQRFEMTMLPLAVERVLAE